MPPRARRLARAVAAALPCLGLPAQMPGYLLAVHGCDTTGGVNCNTPVNHKTYLLTSNDGVAWTVLPGMLPFSGSVPDVVRRGDVLYVYNPMWLHRYRLSTGSWDPPVRVTLNDPNAPYGFVDPSLVLDDQGRINMIYLPGDISGNLGKCPPGVPSCVVDFRSAVEVAGSDGAAFTGVNGVRVGVLLQQGQGSWDPDWFWDGSRWVVYISRGQSVQVYTSATLHGSYALHATLPNGMLVTNLGGVPCGRYDFATGQYWTYVHSNVSQQVHVRLAVHPTLDTPLTSASFQTVVTPATLGLAAGQAASPGITVDHGQMGSALPYGTACGSPQLSGNGAPPVLGAATFGVQLSGAAATTPLALALGAATAAVDLTPFGWPQCTLLARPDVVVPGVTDAQGALALGLPVPFLPSLLDATLYAQAIVATSPGTASAGLAVTLGAM